MLRSKRRDLLVGLGFLAPNILGFCVFILFPLIFSLYLAFTNWDMSLHNLFKDEPLRIVAFENFERLIEDKEFWQYLGNTIFLMLSLPFAIGGSLLAAILLSKDLGSRSTWIRNRLIATGGLVFGTLCLVLAGAGTSAMLLLVVGLAGVIFVGGVYGGSSVYRVLFFVPHFTSGVATHILWKKIYNPSTGPIANSLRPILDGVGTMVEALPVGLFQSGGWLCSLAIIGTVLYGLRKFYLFWRDGDLGGASVGVGSLLIALPVVLGLFLYPDSHTIWLAAAGTLIVLVLGGSYFVYKGRSFTCDFTEGFGTAFSLGAVLMVLGFVFVGLGNVIFQLPQFVESGLESPAWLSDYNWAKPSLMIMGLWAAIGSNNMLLYFAGLSNVPAELYEAAEIDGASPFQRFWHITWPQLAPVTFFIVVMSMIAGLQGGFEMARVMTRGGPAGSTTTLSYYVYNEGFETGHLGYAASISWAMFALVFTVTLFNWKFGNRKVND